ncbi:Exocyst complex component S5 [Coemansia javaensis]|uniref:Exocyst complex component SEC5 n=1 Tax=Coemansia javaensis TaxID=2761396 RepID=A0A9W8LG47_9FUNG|nr:Exocyst complex component S5 [Coemansia javaensis]
MSLVDDAEILARYGLESFTSTTFGAEDGGGGGGRNEGALEEEAGGPSSGGAEAPSRRRSAHSRRRSAHSRRRRTQDRGQGGGREGGGFDSGSEGGGGGGDDDDDDDDGGGGGDDGSSGSDDDGGGGWRQRRESAGGGRGGRYRIPLSDRDPLYVYRSVAAVLESRGGGAAAMGDMAYRAQFSISSREFSPAAFMQTVHSDTPYAQLTQGARLLRESVSQGSEALKILVHNNFDRFVDARSKIDLLYAEMKKRALNDQAEYGTRAFNQSLLGVTRRADEIYSPIMDRRARAEKIRSTLSVIERYKFFFNLPASLVEYTHKGRFDAAVREYKKGRLLLQAVTDDDAAAAAGLDDNDGRPAALTTIFQHVWSEVQGSVVELRAALFRRLGQASRPYSEQENVIRHLLEIDPGDKDPVAFYLEHQHMWIVERLEADYKTARLRALQAGAHAPERLGAGRPASGAGSASGARLKPTPDDERRAGELARALGIESFEDFAAFSHGRDAEFHAWKQIHGAVRALSQTLVRRLPDFWKLCQAYTEELYQRPAAQGPGRRRRQGLNLERVAKCHSLLEGIIERYSQYVLRLVGVLGEGDTVASLDSLDRRSIGATLQRLPQTHALLAGHFMTAIAELVVSAASDIEAIDMAQEPAIILANLISQLKAGLMLFLCEMWARDARCMALHENWRLHHGTRHWPPLPMLRRDRDRDRDAQDAEDSAVAVAEAIANTELPPLFLRMEQTIVGQLGTIHAAAVQPGKSTRTAASQGQAPHFDASFDEGQRQQSERSRMMHDMAMARVKHTFFGTMYSFLDTLHVLAFDAQPGPGAGRAAEIQGHGPLRRQSLDLSRRATAAAAAPGLDARRHTVACVGQAAEREGDEASSFCLLVTLCNLTTFRLLVVPDLLQAKAVRQTFRLDVGDELPQLEKLMRRLDEMIFSCYIRDKVRQLGTIVRRGVLMGGFGWATAEMPRDVQPYVSEALLFLVFTHAEIMDLIAEVSGAAEQRAAKQQPLAKRVFRALTAALAQELLECARAVDAFSEGGMLQCVLEALVISRTLQMYMTPPAAESLRLLYAYVRTAFERAHERARKQAAQQGRTVPEPAGGAMREADGVTLSSGHWDVIRKLLRECTRRTQIQFRCFQQTPSASR